MPTRLKVAGVHSVEPSKCHGETSFEDTWKHMGTGEYQSLVSYCMSNVKLLISYVRYFLTKDMENVFLKQGHM